MKFLSIAAGLLAASAATLCLAAPNETTKPMPAVPPILKAAQEKFAAAQGTLNGTRQKIVENRNQVTAAKRELGRAKDTMGRSRFKAQSAVQNKPEWKAAQLEFTKAKAAYDAAARPVLPKVRASADYRTAYAVWQKAKAKQIQSQSQVKLLGAEGLKLAADDLKAAEAALRDLEAKGLMEDPTVAAAKTALDEAQARIDALKEEIETALGSDAAFGEAKDKVAAAEASVATCTTELQDLAKTEVASLDGVKSAQIELGKAAAACMSGST